MIDFIFQFPVLCTFILGLATAYIGAGVSNTSKYVRYWKYADIATVLGVILMLLAGFFSLYR